MADLPSTTASVKSPRRGRGWLWIPAIILLALIAYTPLTLWWSYSEGERVGVLQKLSRKGWVCKTYEGELALYVVSGVSPQIFPFSVRDAAVAEQLNASLGQRIRVHYTEHRGVPTNCFGETGYFVDRVSVAAP